MQRLLSENWAGPTSVLLHGVIVAAVIMFVNPPMLPTIGEAPVPVTLVNLTPPAAPPPPAVVEDLTPPPITTTAREVQDTTPVKKPHPKPQLKKPVPQPQVTDVTPSPAPPSNQPPAEMPVQQPQAASPSPTYLSLVYSQLERNKVYPHVARIRKEQGTALLRFVVDRNGRVLTHRIDRSSGHGDLDHEVEEMLNRAQPLPVMPPDMTQAQIEIVVPVQFYLR
jgi:protein TonB